MHVYLIPQGHKVPRVVWAFNCLTQARYQRRSLIYTRTTYKKTFHCNIVFLLIGLCVLPPLKQSGATFAQLQWKYNTRLTQIIWDRLIFVSFCFSTATFSCTRGSPGLLEPIAAVSERMRGHTLDKSPVCLRATEKDKQPFALAPLANLEWPV